MAREKISIHNDNFTGLWLSRDLIMCAELNYTEKITAAQIQSLDKGKGCFASNRYFAELFQVSEGQIANVISRLRKKGFIKDISFDGKTRYMSFIPERLAQSETIHDSMNPDDPIHDSMNTYSQNDEHPIHDSIKSYIRIESKEESKEKESHSDESEDDESEKQKTEEQKPLNQTQGSISEHKSSEVKVPGIQMSSVEKPKEPKKKPGLKALTDPHHLEILRSYQKNIYSMCGSKTSAIIEGIPRAIEIFKEHYEDQAVQKILEALAKLGYEINTQQWWKERPHAVKPKIVWSASFIENTLLPLTNNLETDDGKLYNNPLSDAELRQIEEDNARKAAEFRATLRKDGAGN